jgi:hypothetical protein
MPYKDPKRNKECIDNYRQTHKAEIHDKQKVYCSTHKKQRNITQKDWIKKHPEEWKKIQRRSGKKRRDILRKEIIQLLGEKCSNPYNLNHGDFLVDSRCLQIDHVNRESKHREKKNGHATSGNEAYLRFILKEIKSGSKDYQLLCANCNWIKRVENREDGRRNRKL